MERLPQTDPTAPNPNQLVLPHHFTTPRVFPVLRLLEAPNYDDFGQMGELIDLFPPDEAA